MKIKVIGLQNCYIEEITSYLRNKLSAKVYKTTEYCWAHTEIDSQHKLCLDQDVLIIVVIDNPYVWLKK